VLKILGLIVAVGYLPTMACTPDLQPAFFCAPDLTVGYAEAPAGLLTPQTQKIVAAYTSLSGQWKADWQCPPGSADSGTIGAVIETATTEEMLVIVGSDPSQPGNDCRHAGTVLADGKISLTGDPVSHISVRTATLQARLGGTGVVIFKFDTTSDTEFSDIEGLLIIEEDLTIQSTVSFGRRPKRNPDGSMSQEGYDCGLILSDRL
jgi:hypothetical protein